MSPEDDYIEPPQTERRDSHKGYWTAEVVGQRGHRQRSRSGFLAKRLVSHCIEFQGRTVVVQQIEIECSVEHSCVEGRDLRPYLFKLKKESVRSRCLLDDVSITACLLSPVFHI